MNNFDLILEKLTFLEDALNELNYLEETRTDKIKTLFDPLKLKLNSLENSINELKNTVLEQRDTNKFRIYLYPLNSSNEINEESKILYIFSSFDEEKIKSFFNVQCISKRFTKDNRILHAKKFTTDTRKLLIADSFEELLKEENKNHE